ncbi:MAG: T9SS type A sorting domain-containing protein [Flavobacteriales bacterium]|nr:hypothetical protein [Flavobacteriales bacterium]MCC6578619.1 T9SS type A sorting domain-containing protein [Flavobacteriales bacterium]NUQ16541.1 T9SS type A sorting domain-containing protein [Flavobacteriales bacterium]
MKQTLLSLSLFLATTAASAQCVPNPLYADSAFGVWPDTTENFVSGMVNVFYADTLNMIVPQDAGEIDPQFAGLMLDSVRLNNIAGLPPGLTVECNSQTGAACTYLTGILGCGAIVGTPTSEGVYPLTINVTAFANLLGNPVPVDYPFSGYSITIVPNNVGIAEEAVALGGVRNVPNPFMDRTTIEFQLNRPGAVTIRLFDLLGAEVRNMRMSGKAGLNRYVLNAQGLQDGLYLYKLESGGTSFTGRMVLSR